MVAGALTAATVVSAAQAAADGGGPQVTDLHLDAAGHVVFSYAVPTGHYLYRLMWVVDESGKQTPSSNLWVSGPQLGYAEQECCYFPNSPSATGVTLLDTSTNKPIEARPGTLYLQIKTRPIDASSNTINDTYRGTSPCPGFPGAVDCYSNIANLAVPRPTTTTAKPAPSSGSPSAPAPVLKVPEAGPAKDVTKDVVPKIPAGCEELKGYFGAPSYAKAAASATARAKTANGAAKGAYQAAAGKALACDKEQKATQPVLAAAQQGAKAAKAAEDAAAKAELLAEAQALDAEQKAKEAAAAVAGGDPEAPKLQAAAKAAAAAAAKAKADAAAKAKDAAAKATAATTASKKCRQFVSLHDRVLTVHCP